MRFAMPAILSLLALIHALPVAGVLGAEQLAQLYGLPVHDPQLALLLRHRAVLFGIVAGLLAAAVAWPALRLAALLAALASVGSFLVLAAAVPSLGPALLTVVRVDWVALALAVAGLAMWARSPASRPWRRSASPPPRTSRAPRP